MEYLEGNLKLENNEAKRLGRPPLFDGETMEIKFLLPKKLYREAGRQAESSGKFKTDKLREAIEIGLKEMDRREKRKKKRAEDSIHSAGH